MERVKDILRQYEIKGEGKVLSEWQVWALDFCKKYSIPRKDYGRVMSIAKQYQDKIDYLRYIDGWLSDYPNLRGNVLRLFFWKIAEDNKKNKPKEKQSNLIYM
mgnify:CR=1 FL=1|jgi:predicted RNase H-like nuclease